MNIAMLVLCGARSAGFVMKAPGFSHPATPKPVRAMLACALAIATAAGLPAHAAVEGLVLQVLCVREFCIGALFGVMAAALYDGAYAGGRALDDYLGIRASMPTATVQSGSGFGRLWSNAMLATFFLCGGCEFALAAFAQTFVTLPVDTLPTRTALYGYAVQLPRTLGEAALTIVGPAIALAFFAQLVLGGVARIVPRFSSFTLSFPIVFAVALFITFATAPSMLGLGAHPVLPMLRHV